MDVRTFKLIIALGMMFAAVLVIVTCVWKLVKVSNLIKSITKVKLFCILFRIDFCSYFSWLQGSKLKEEWRNWNK